MFEIQVELSPYIGLCVSIFVCGPDGIARILAVVDGNLSQTNFVDVCDEATNTIAVNKNVQRFFCAVRGHHIIVFTG